MKAEIFVIDIDSISLSVFVEVNGVVLRHQAASQRARGAFKLNGWEVAGRNLLRVLLARLPDEEEGRDNGKLKLSLRSASPNKPPEAATVLGVFAWPGAIQEPLTGLPREVFRLEFDANPAAIWSWTRADALPSPSEKDLGLAADLLDALVTAFVRRDIPKIMKIQEIQISEGAIALGLTPSDMLADYRDLLMQRIGSGGWAVNPLDRPGLRFIPMAGGRLHKAEGPNGALPIIANSAEGKLGLEPFLARVSGSWIIAR